LELLCILKRLESDFKVKNILSKLFETYDILKIDETIVYFAWFIGSNYKMHAGDSIHISFCLLYKINSMLVKDKGLIDSFLSIIGDLENNLRKNIKIFFENLPISNKKLEIFNDALYHLKTIKLIKI